MSLTIFLGAHQPSWLSRMTTPLFVSRRRLAPLKTHKRATCEWVLDSGGFSELGLFGEWKTTPTQYMAEARRWRDEIGGLRWAAIQDWMCEPFMLEKTGKSITEHQRLTIESLDRLRNAAPDVPWAPVLQGWSATDYYSHVEQYDRAGFDLTKEPIVGVGSVCRRQHTATAEVMLRTLKAIGLKLHGFGFKALGMQRCWDVLESSDSMAWSFQARRYPPLPECRGKHSSCANCPRYAMWWQERVERGVRAARNQREAQTEMFAS